MSVRDTKEYKRKSAKLKKGKVCEWCGSSENLYVHHPQDLFPIPEETRKAIYAEAYSEFRALFKQEQKESNREQFKLEYRKYLEENGIKAKIKTEIEESTKRYVSLEGTVVICRRCHFAIHKGMDLCQVCKVKYKKKQYETCYNCSSQEKKGTEDDFKLDLGEGLSFHVMPNKEQKFSRNGFDFKLTAIQLAFLLKALDDPEIKEVLDERSKDEKENINMLVI